MRKGRFFASVNIYNGAYFLTQNGFQTTYKSIYVPLHQYRKLVGGSRKEHAYQYFHFCGYNKIAGCNNKHGNGCCSANSANCKVAYTCGYNSHQGKACSGRNELGAYHTYYGSWDANWCKTLCDANTNCISYEYYVNPGNWNERKCQLSSSCTEALLTDYSNFITSVKVQYCNYIYCY